MKKTYKKIENNLHKTLTIACEDIKDQTNLFSWLTHDVDYNSFPKSLLIRCCLSDSQALNSIENSELDTIIKQIIKKQLNAIGIDNFNIHKQITYMVEH